MLGFHVTVIDDRASFANRERFPDADEIIVKPFKQAIDSLALDGHCYLGVDHARPFVRRGSCARGAGCSRADSSG